ncbi:Cellulose synthase-like protein E6 [Vitis vinifera]|uniref:Cellulose synthase-like protein E6 n=1 Tax=Vitis vinifera TaxID=29760 RepID=A0A438HS02_VITVI|nr:Cellulose synthase-like protein E6 [Vitis vinifera]
MIRRSFACAIVRKIHADMFLGAPKDEDNANERRLEMELYLIDVLEMKMMVIAYRAEVVDVWKMGRDGQLPLFETKAAKGRILFGLYAVSTFVGICLICVYRLTHLPEEGKVGRWAWIGLFLSELGYILYWFITVTVRLKPIYRYTFKDRLTQRYEKVLPGIDIFVCTANPIIEPPTMVINTVLSVMAYDYPPEKLSVYLSDDGGSCLTFYALLEASQFSKVWLPFCKKFKVEPRCPEAYFSSTSEPHHDDPSMAEEWSSIKVKFAYFISMSFFTSVCCSSCNNGKMDDILFFFKQSPEL